MTFYINTQPTSNQHTTNVFENQQPAAPASPFQSSANRISAIVVDSDQSILKGALWGVAAFKLGSSTCALATGTLVSAVIFPPAAIPLALATYFFGCLTNDCIENTSYHLGSTRKVIILQNQ